MAGIAVPYKPPVAPSFGPAGATIAAAKRPVDPKVKLWMDTIKWNQAAAAHTPFGPVKPTPLGLPAGAEAQFGQQRQSVGEQYQTALAGNDYNRSGVQQDYVRQFRDMADSYNKQREQMPYGANARGLLGSGIYRQGLQDYAQQRTRAYGDLNTAQTQQLGGFDLVRKQIESQRAQALASIEAQRQALMGQIGPGTIQ